MKEIIYYSIGDKKEYIDLLNLSLNSLLQTGYTGDLLFLIRENIYIDIINSLLKNVKNKIFFWNVSDVECDIYQLNAPSSKLLINVFNRCEDYEKFIFCDVDTIWLNNPTTMFLAIDDVTICFGSGFRAPFTPLINHPAAVWGEPLLTKQERDFITTNQVIAANSGVFGFSKNVRHILGGAFEYMKNNIRNLKDICKAPGVVQTVELGLEQPFLIVYAWRNKSYSHLLSEYAFSGGLRPGFLNDYKNNKHTKYKKLSVVHFPNNVGDFNTKLNVMMSFKELIS